MSIAGEEHPTIRLDLGTAGEQRDPTERRIPLQQSPPAQSGGCSDSAERRSRDLCRRAVNTFIFENQSLNKCAILHTPKSAIRVGWFSPFPVIPPHLHVPPFLTGEEIDHFLKNRLRDRIGEVRNHRPQPPLRRRSAAGLAPPGLWFSPVSGGRE